MRLNKENSQNSQKSDESQLLKPGKAAKRLDVARTLILKWIEEGRIPFVLLGTGPSFLRKGKLIKGKRILRIKETDLEKFIEEHENTTRERDARRLRLASASGRESKMESA